MADLTIKVAADTTGLANGFAQIRSALTSLQGTLQQLTAVISDSSKNMGLAFQNVASAIKLSGEAADGSGKKLAEMSKGLGQIKKGADALQKSWKAIQDESGRAFKSGQDDGEQFSTALTKAGRGAVDARGKLSGFLALIPKVGPALEAAVTVVEGFYTLCGSMSDQLATSWMKNQAAISTMTNVLQNGLTQALAPAMRDILDTITTLVESFTQSAQQGGAVAVVFSALGTAATLVGVIISGIGNILNELWVAASEVIGEIANIFSNLFAGTVSKDSGVIQIAVNLIKDAFIVLKDVVAIVVNFIKLHLDALAGFANASAKVLHDLFTLQWDKIGADWNAGVKQLASNVEKTFSRMEDSASELGKAIAAAVHGETPNAKPQPAVAAQPASPRGHQVNGSIRSTALSVVSSSHATTSTADSFPSIVGAAKKPLEMSADIAALNTQVISCFKKIDTVGNQTAGEQKKKWKSLADSISNAFGSSLQGMIKGTQNFRGMMLNIGNAILGEATKWIQKKVSTFLTGELAQTAATTAGVTTRTGIEATGAATSQGISATNSLTQIAHSAAVAAAGAYAAIAKIPIVGPVLAPLAAAAALAGVIALGKSIFSAEGGMGQVPYDGAMFELHKDEMVLPASLATPMRSMLLNPAANNNASSSANDGAVTHNHYYDIKAMDGQDVHRVLMRHHTSVARAANKAYRYGYKPA